MTTESTEALRRLLERFEADASTVRTREDLNRLRMYWGDVRQILDNESETE